MLICTFPFIVSIPVKWRPTRLLLSTRTGAYSKMRLHGSDWKDDPSWRTQLSDSEIVHAQAQLHDFIERANRLVVITGAGLSTASGIPDYRGPHGSYKTGHTPMSHQEFMSSKTHRQRYWARSMYGYGRFSAVRPNRGHKSLALLEHANRVHHVITQNVDGLSSQAGSKRVTDLHGRIDRVKCLTCGAMHRRDDVQVGVSLR